jgi:WD40 repeat protein
MHSSRMKKKIRRLLLLIAVICFTSLSPLVIAHALGYRLSLPNVAPAPIGVLILESYPKKARITIAGRAHSGTTPEAVTNLPAGNIDVSITKDQYLPWQKNITIEPFLVNDYRNIRLFPSSIEPRKLHEQNILMFSLSPNRRLIALQTTEHDLYLIDDEGSSYFSSWSMTEPATHLLWSPNSNSLVITTATQAFYLELAARQPTLVSTPELAGVLDLAWDQRFPGRLLYLSASRHLYAYYFSSGTRSLIASQVNLFSPSTRDIYLINREDQLLQYDLRGNLLQEIPVNGRTIKQIKITPAGRLAALTGDNTVSIFNTDGLITDIPLNASRFGWSPDGQLLYLLSEDTSLYVYNAADDNLPFIAPGDHRLIVRFSRPIRDPQWFAGGHHLIYQLDDEIYVTEIDTRDHPISAKIDSTNLGSAAPAVGYDGSILFYLKRFPDGTKLVASNLTL